MKIYIASSWKNQHAVQMLTALLKERGHEVLSFIENNHGENKVHASFGEKAMPFEEWVWSDSGQRSFNFDINGAMFSDLVIYIAPSGQDAWAEVGAAYGKGVPILGLWAKGESVGLMRRMVLAWYEDYNVLLVAVAELSGLKKGASA